MSSFIAAESAPDAQRWEVPVFFGAEPEIPHTAQHLDELERSAYEDGYTRGHQEGYSQGYAKGAQEVREQSQRLRAVLEHLAKPLKDLDAEVERMLIALALEVGGRLAQQALRESPEGVTAIIQEAVAALAGPLSDARIHLHPADAELLKNVEVLPPEAGSWRLIADHELQRGDCRVITPAAQVDARLDTRAASVAQALLGERN